MSDPWRRALACAGVLAIHLAIVLSVAQQPFRVSAAPPQSRSWIWPLHNDTVHRVGPAADLFAVVHAGRALEAGIDPYAEDGQRVGGVPYYYPFRYLPVVGSTLGRALAQLSPHAAWWSWIAVLELLLGTTVACLCRRTPDPRLRASMFVLLLLQSPYFLELHMGQFTFAALALLGITAALADDPPARTRTAATLNGIVTSVGFLLSAALKPIALAAVPAFLRRRGDAIVVAIALATLFMLSARYFAIHPEQWQTFAALNLADPVEGMDAGNTGLTYLVYLAAQDLGLSQGPSLPAGFLIGWRYAWLAVVAALVLASRSRSAALATCALVLAHFLGFAHVWEHHASGIVVIGAVLLVALSRQPRPAGRHAVALTLGALVLLALPTPYALFDTARDPRIYDPSFAWPRYAAYLCAASKALPTLLLFGVAARELWLHGWRWQPAGASRAIRASASALEATPTSYRYNRRGTATGVTAIGRACR